MKAIVCRNYGSPDVLELEEVEKPIAGDDEVLLRVRAASVNPLDRHLMRGKPYIGRVFFGLRRPKIARPGVDVAGQVEAVGKNVTRLKPGDEVFGGCRGAFAQYVCTSESALVLKPGNVTFEQAAAAPVAAYTALQGLRDKGRLRPGQKVVIHGAAGGVGTFAVQIAKALGAEVTGVCSTGNVEMVRSLGADHVVDYTREDFTRSGRRYDVIFDLVADHSLFALRRVLEPEGIYVAAGILGIGSMIVLPLRWMTAIVLSRLGSRKLVFFMAKRSQEDLTFIAGLMDTGKVKPVIGRRYGLSEVPEAIRYLGTGHARGKLIVIVD